MISLIIRLKYDKKNYFNSFRLNLHLDYYFVLLINECIYEFCYALKMKSLLFYLDDVINTINWNYESIESECKYLVLCCFSFTMSGVRTSGPQRDNAVTALERIVTQIFCHVVNMPIKNKSYRHRYACGARYPSIRLWLLLSKHR